MRSPRILAVAILLAFPLSSVGAKDDSFEGQITDDRCKRKHIDGRDAAQCARDCVEDGAKFILLVDGKSLALDRQDDARGYAGRTVIVKGKQEGDSIRVSQIRGK